MKNHARRLRGEANSGWKEVVGKWVLRVLAATVLVVGIAKSAQAHEAPKAILSILVSDYAHLSPFTLAKTEGEAGKILGQAGLQVVWVNCPQTQPAERPNARCEGEPAADSLVLRMLPKSSSADIPDSEFGFAVAPILASVYVEGAAKLADSDGAEFELPVILGCTIAHEIGHLLLGAQSHASSGIMQAQWGRNQIRQAMTGRLLFRGEESILIQREAETRMRSVQKRNAETVHVDETSVAAGRNGDKQITIRIHNYAQVESGDLVKAERIADDILQKAGVEAVWIECLVGQTPTGKPACQTPMGSTDLMLNLLPRFMSDRYRLRLDAFGFALEGEDGRFGFFAAIFCDLVKDAAAQRQLTRSVLLGTVIAHELGHLLLSTNSHASFGVMRAHWSGKELLAVEHSATHFSSPESKRIQQAVMARWRYAAGSTQEQTPNMREQ